MMRGHKRVCNSFKGGACDCSGVIWKLVPLEPTAEMIAAGAGRLVLRDSDERREAEAERCWRSMVVAAPQLDAKVYAVAVDARREPPKFIVRDGVPVPLAEVVRLLNEHQKLIEALFEPLLGRRKV